MKLSHEVYRWSFFLWIFKTQILNFYTYFEITGSRIITIAYLLFLMQLYWMFNKTIALVCKDIILQWKTKKLMTKFTFSSTSVFSFLTMNWNWLSTVTIKLSFYIKIIHNTCFNMNWNMPSFLGTFHVIFTSF